MTGSTTFRGRLLAATFALAAFPAAVHAGGSGSHGHGGSDSHGHGASSPIGEPGKPGRVSRTIEVTMHDSYYVPETIQVEAGETVRIVVRNEGELVHEFSIGTADMHAHHQEEMAAMMDRGVLFPDHIDHERMKMDTGTGHTMQHDDPNSTLLEPGESGEIVWHFTETGELQFACNVPGHYEAGMVGMVHVQ